MAQEQAAKNGDASRNDASTNDDACMINLCPYSGIRFVDMLEHRPEYRGDIRRIGLLTPIRVNEAGTSPMAPGRYLSHRDLEIDTPEDEVELGMDYIDE